MLSVFVTRFTGHDAKEVRYDETDYNLPEL